MATSFYELSVPTFLQTVRAVGGFLDRAVRHCAETGADPDDFVSVRLYNDMAPFHFQIEAAWHHAVWGLEAAKTRVFEPPCLVGPVPFAALRAMIGKAETALDVSANKRSLGLNSSSIPNPAAIEAAKELKRLLTIIAALRDPFTGCPWDKVQTFATIAPYTVEEAYEVADAIARQDMAALPDELGDLLLQVVYHAQIAEEAGLFSFADVARAIADKMVRRHPHVFPGPNSDAEIGGWEAQKLGERRARNEHGALAGVAPALPALTRALKLTMRAGRVGFDWPDAERVLEKLEEEIAEVRDELAVADPARLADEVGDVLFVAANLARKLGLDPEACLQQANEKFARRFNAVERRLAERGTTPGDVSLAEMEAEWTAVKQTEPGRSSKI